MRIKSGKEEKQEILIELLDYFHANRLIISLKLNLDIENIESHFPEEKIKCNLN